MTISFGTSGWRGIIADDFTQANVRLCTQALADQLHAQGQTSGTVLVGYDTRFMGRQFALSACGVLQANGFDVALANAPVPTPAVGWNVVNTKSLAGICFTASHNPPEYQGYKIITPWGGIMGSAETADLTKRAQTIKPENIKYQDPTPAVFDFQTPYIDHLFALLGPAAKPLRILVNPMHGTTAHYLPALLTRQGHHVTTINTTQDPLFGGLQPDPAPHNLADMVSQLKAGTYDLGLATDADGDRFGILDPDGTVLNPNDVLALLLNHTPPGPQKAVGLALVTADIVRAAAAHQGLEVVETAVGFKHLGALMATHKTYLGLEESSGFAWSAHLPDKDGTLACALFAQLVSTTGKTPNTLKADLYQTLGPNTYERLDLKLPNPHKERLMAHLKTTTPTTIAGATLGELVTTDGLKFILSDGRWLALRPSGTEPLVRIYLNAPTAEGLAQLKATAQHWVQQTA